MKGKKIKPFFWLKLLIIILISLIPTHLINILIAMYVNDNKNKPNINEYKTHLYDFVGVTQKTMTVLPSYTPLLLILIFTVLICYLVQGILLDENGYSDADEIGLHGTSKWGNPHELMNGKTLAKRKNSRFSKDLNKSLNMENGYIIGKVPNKNELLIMHDKTDIDNHNIAVIGSSGAGKGQSYVIPNLINIKNKSIIATDPKGELFDETSQLKRDQGYKVYQVDFVNFKQSKYNPLYYVESPLDAQKIANSIISNFEKGDGGGSQFFKNSAINILSALIVYVKAEYPKEEANLEKVVDVYDEHVQDEEHFLEWVDTIKKEHPAKPLLNNIKELTDVTRKSVTSTLSNGFSLFKLPEVKAMTKTNDFNFEDFIEEKAILYVKVSMKDNTFAPLTSVFFNQMINVYYDIAGQSKGNKLERPVVFMLDEFANIGKLDDYSNTLATCRGLGLSMHTIIQNRAQLEKKSMYGKEEAADILGNHDTTILLRADQKDTATTKWLSDALGDTTISQRKNDMTKSKGNISKQIGDNYLKRPLMTPAEIGSMKRNECIVMINGQDPLFLEKAYQSKVYPNLITKEIVETVNGEEKKKYAYNYDEVRASLGYNTPIFEMGEYDVEKQLTFSEMHELKEKERLEKEATKNIQNNEISEDIQNNEDENQSSEHETKKEFDDYITKDAKEDIDKTAEKLHSSFTNEEIVKLSNLHQDTFKDLSDFNKCSEKTNDNESFDNLNQNDQEIVVKDSINEVNKTVQKVEDFKNNSKNKFGYNENDRNIDL